MSKVITFSRFFPSTHKEKGKPTYFVADFLQWFKTEKEETFVGQIICWNDSVPY